MTPLRILTVDDEPLALRRMKLLLQTVPQTEHVGEAGGCAEALAKIETMTPDILLLDIMMRDGNGFEVVEALPRTARPPVVIFVTAFDQYAVRAFDSVVVDYLLKPVERERLVRAIARAGERVAQVDAEQRVAELQMVVRQLRAAQHEEEALPFESEFWLRGANGLVRVPVDTINVVSSEDEYIGLHTTGGSHLMRSSIRQFLERVEPDLFVRIHRKWLVRRASISELSTRRMGRPEIVLHNGQRLPAGRVYLKELRRTMQRPEAA